MESRDLDLTNISPEELARMLSETQSALAQHSQSLEKQSASMENLSQAIRMLDSTLKKLVKTEEVSLQLRQAINTFVEQQINPFYYQLDMYALPNSQPVKHHRLTKGKPLNATN